jgi:hypothetical protein
MTEYGISRRRLLTFGGLVVGSAMVAPALGGTAARADPGGVSFEAVGDDPVNVLAADGSAAVTAVPRQLAVRVSSGSALPAGTQLKLTFDDRIYAPVDPPVVTLGGRPIPTTATRTGNLCTITLHAAVPSGADSLIAVAGTARQISYPYDLVRKPAGTGAEVPATPHTAHSSRALHARGAAPAHGTTMPWGIELSGGWDKQTWGPAQEFSYYRPVLATLRNVGPGATPGRVGFTVSVDPRLVRTIRPGALRLKGKAAHGRVTLVGEHRDDTVYETRWLLPAKLNNGDVFDVLLDATLASPAGALTTIRHPVLSLSSLGSSTTRRDTGLNSLTRQDSVYG